MDIIDVTTLLDTPSAITTGVDPSVVSASEQPENLQGLIPITKMIDVDTFEGADGNRYRVQGLDAPEVSKMFRDKTGGATYKPGTAGGTGSLKAFNKFMQESGKLYIQDMGVDAAHGRKTGRVIDSQGRDVGEQMMISGALKIHEGVTADQLQARAFGQFARSFGYSDPNQDRYDALALEVNQAMASEGYDPLQFKQMAINEAEYARNPEAYLPNIVKYRSNDRDIMNRAYSPFSSSLGTALVGVVEAGYGFSSMIGEITGSEDLQNWGESGVYRKGDEITERAKVLLDYKEVENAGDAFDFVANNVAMSLPYMAMTMASIAAAPLTGGASLAIPASVYTGAIYNEQADDAKSPALALTGGVMQGAIDVFGGKLLLNSFGKMGTPKEILKAGADELKRLNISTEDAALMTKQQLAKVSTEMSDIVKGQIRSRERIGEILKGSAMGAGTEAVTEATQELIGYTAAHTKDRSFNFTEAGERMLSAAVAGGSIGATFSGAGGLWDQAKAEQAVWAGSRADGSGVSNSGTRAQEELAKYGRINTNEENANEARESLKGQTKKGQLDMFGDEVPSTNSQGDSFQDKGERGDMKSEVKNLSDLLWKGVSEIPGLWRGSTRNAFTETLKSQSRSIRKLADMFGGNLQKTFSGADFESFKFNLAAKYQHVMGDPAEIYAVFNYGKRVSAKDRARISDELYEIGQAAVDKDGNPDYKTIPDVIEQINAKRKEEGKEVMIDPNLANQYKEILERAEKTAQLMYEDQNRYYKEAGGVLGNVKNYLATFKTLDKAAVARDPVKFKVLLKEEYNLSDKAASDLVERILENPLKADIDGLLEDDSVFSVTKGSPIPGSHRSRSLGLAKNEKFANFMERDFFANVDYATKSAARFQGYQQFVGVNGSIINQLLEQAKAEGVPQADIDKLAMQMRDYLDAESGNYKRATSEFGKTIQRIQKNFVTYMVFVGLPMATVSSLVELSLTMKSLSNEQIFGKGGLKTMGQELGNMIYNAGGEVSSVVTRKHFTNRESPAMSRLRELGYFDNQVGAASKTGVTETNALRQNLLSVFFKWNGLQGWTQMTRAIRAGIAWDYMYDHLETITMHPQGEPLTNAVEEAHEALRNLGLNQGDITQLTILGTLVDNGMADEADMARLRELTVTATKNFIDDAIMMPGGANRPLFYQDPRFALFTQFQGFISVFQSTFIPKLWGEYVKRGSPEMTYQAFSMMVLMIAMGFASQELKDRLKFGGENPYLDGFEKGRRAINSSGLLGTGERVINTIFPIYESRSDNVGEWAVGEVVGQAPVLGSITSLASGVGDLIEQDYDMGVNKLLRGTPIAPFTALRHKVRDVITGKNNNDWDTGD
tara:strand:+ start:1688 stop:5734 length:4047 start_codon:yes stop_codon:yes gene_type:complete